MCPCRLPVAHFLSSLHMAPGASSAWDIHAWQAYLSKLSLKYGNCGTNLTRHTLSNKTVGLLCPRWEAYRHLIRKSSILWYDLGARLFITCRWLSLNCRSSPHLLWHLHTWLERPLPPICVLPAFGNWVSTLGWNNYLFHRECLSPQTNSPCFCFLGMQNYNKV